MTAEANTHSLPYFHCMRDSQSATRKITCIANVLCQCISTYFSFQSCLFFKYFKYDLCKKIIWSHITEKNSLITNHEEVVVHCTLCQCSYVSKCKKTKDQQRNWIFWGTNSTDLKWTPKMSRSDKRKTPQIIRTMSGEEHEIPNPRSYKNVFKESLAK